MKNIYQEIMKSVYKEENMTKRWLEEETKNVQRNGPKNENVAVTGNTLASNSRKVLNI